MNHIANHFTNSVNFAKKQRDKCTEIEQWGHHNMYFLFSGKISSFWLFMTNDIIDGCLLLHEVNRHVMRDIVDLMGRAQKLSMQTIIIGRRKWYWSSFIKNTQGYNQSLSISRTYIKAFIHRTNCRSLFRFVWIRKSLIKGEKSGSRDKHII